MADFCKCSMVDAVWNVTVLPVEYSRQAVQFFSDGTPGVFEVAHRVKAVARTLSCSTCGLLVRSDKVTFEGH